MIERRQSHLLISNQLKFILFSIYLLTFPLEFQKKSPRKKILQNRKPTKLHKRLVQNATTKGTKSIEEKKDVEENEDKPEDVKKEDPTTDKNLDAPE